jgi:hypothetical protein
MKRKIAVVLLLFLTVGLTYAGLYALNTSGEPSASGYTLGTAATMPRAETGIAQDLNQPPAQPDAAKMQAALAMINRPGPAIPNAGQPTAPGAGTETQPQLPGTFTFFKDTVSSGVATTGSSSVNEPSVGNSGKYAFVTANWYAAKTSNLGTSPPTWTFVNPYSNFPSSLGGGFCCDQDAIYSVSRDAYFWERLETRVEAAVLVPMSSQSQY